MSIWASRERSSGESVRVSSSLSALEESEYGATASKTGVGSMETPNPSDTTIEPTNESMTIARPTPRNFHCLACAILSIAAGRDRSAPHSEQRDGRTRASSCRHARQRSWVVGRVAPDIAKKGAAAKRPAANGIVIIGRNGPPMSMGIPVIMSITGMKASDETSPAR